MIVPVLLFLTSAAASPVATATATRDAIASPHATMRELGLVPRAPIPHGEEHEQRRSFASKIRAVAAEAPIRSESVVTKPSLAAPRVLSSFAGSHDLGWNPSDAAGAVSSKYLLHASNASILVQDRTGAILSNIPLESFWHDPAYTDGTVYDSRVLYDAVADRWILCTLYDVNYNKSTLLIAVSDNGNPSLGWHRYRFLVDPNDIREADATRAALTRDSIVITANIYTDNSESSDLYIVRKTDAYAGTATLPITDVQTQGIELTPVDGRDDAIVYLVTPSNTEIDIYSVSGSTFTSVGSPQPPPLGIISGQAGGSAPQLGSTLKLDCGYISVPNAVLRNGTLWVASQIDMNNPFRTSVMWWRIGMSTPLKVDTGIVDDPTGATMYAFPSIAVNKLGAALIGYSVFSASIYPSGGYSYIDPFNSLSKPAVMKAGDGPSHLSRWSDFSGTVVDANDVDFWTIQTYAPTFIAANGYWATWWARIEMPALARRRAALH
ncbi:MAG TPA: hypothetical protein VNN25_06650 [Thermoanaerobaculia bacterium]|nr:hypothetical protein [Thermoanaerobaculia bacterium]